MITEDNKLVFRCLECENNFDKEFNKELTKRFKSKYEFCNGDIHKFILLLRKGIYPCIYIHSWERFGKTLLPDKKAFYSSLNMYNVTDVDYRYKNNAFKNFELKYLGVYHDL